MSTNTTETIHPGTRVILHAGTKDEARGVVKAVAPDRCWVRLDGCLATVDLDVKMNELSLEQVDKDTYEKELAGRQARHLERVADKKRLQWMPCAHDGCQQCHGTGIKLDGSRCVHNISCYCNKCRPFFL